MNRLAALLRRLRDDRRGATAVVTALGFVTLLGFVGLGVDLGVAYSQRRAAQSAADSAAFSGAVARAAGTADVTNQARAVAAGYGFKNAQGGVVVQVFSPAVSGTRAGVTDTVEVVVERPMQRFFGRVFNQAAGTIRARAVAVAGATGDACVIAFNPTATNAVLLNGTADVDLIGCSLYGNSSASSALYLNGSPKLHAKSVELVGNWGSNGTPDFTTQNGKHTGQKPFSDPYEGVRVPDFKNQPCQTVITPSSGSYTVPQQGPITRICNLSTINANPTINFPPGIYVLDGTSFRTNGGATINANGVTFVLTSSSGPAPIFRMNGTGVLNLTPPTGGPTAGMSIFQDGARPAGGIGNVVNGNSTSGLRGALYFPKQDVTFNGGNNTSGGCLQLLADTIRFNGNADFEVNCAGSGVRGVGGASTELVE